MDNVVGGAADIAYRDGGRPYDRHIADRYIHTRTDLNLYTKDIGRLLLSDTPCSLDGAAYADAYAGNIGAVGAFYPVRFLFFSDTANARD